MSISRLPTIPAAELARIKSGDCHWRFRTLVKRPEDAGWTDMAAVAGGDWQQGFEAPAGSLDAPAETFAITFLARADGRSDAPGVSGDPLNRNAQDVFAPILNAGNYVEVYAACDSVAGAGDGPLRFWLEGRIGNVAWPGESVVCTVRNLAGRLARAQIKDPRVERGAADPGTPLATEIQELLTLYAPWAPPLVTIGDPEIGVGPYVTEFEPLLPQLREWPRSQGWDLRPLWNEDAGREVPTLFLPPRDKTVPDLALYTDEIREVTALEVGDEYVRNDVVIAYPDAAGELVEVHLQDAASIAQYGEVPMRIELATGDPSANATSAAALGGYAISDLAQPPMTKSLQIHFNPWLSTHDLLAVQADDVRFDYATEWAVLGAAHTVTGDDLSTVVDARGGKPVGQYFTWLARPDVVQGGLETSAGGLGSPKYILGTERTGNVSEFRAVLTITEDLDNTVEGVEFDIGDGAGWDSSLDLDDDGEYVSHPVQFLVGEERRREIKTALLWFDGVQQRRTEDMIVIEETMAPEVNGELWYLRTFKDTYRITAKFDRDVRSYRYLYSLSAPPTEAAVAEATEQELAEGMYSFSFETAEEVPVGTTIYVGIIPYDTHGAPGPFFQSSLTRQMEEPATGSVKLRIDQDGWVDLDASGIGQQARYARYKVGLTDPGEDPAGAIDTTGRAYSLSPGNAPAGNYNFEALNVLQLDNESQTAYVRVWWYNTSDGSGAPGPGILTTIPGVRRAALIRSTFAADVNGRLQLGMEAEYNAKSYKYVLVEGGPEYDRKAYPINMGAGIVRNLDADGEDQLDLGPAKPGTWYYLTHLDYPEPGGAGGASERRHDEAHFIQGANEIERRSAFASMIASNASFDLDTNRDGIADSWVRFNDSAEVAVFQVSTDFAIHGVASQMIAGAFTTLGGWSDPTIRSSPFAVHALERYRFTIGFYEPSAVADSEIIRVAWFSETNVFTPDSPALLGTQELSVEDFTPGWNQASAVAQAPAGAVWCCLIVGTRGFERDGNPLYYDRAIVMSEDAYEARRHLGTLSSEDGILDDGTLIRYGAGEIDLGDSAFRANEGLDSDGFVNLVVPRQYAAGDLQAIDELTGKINRGITTADGTKIATEEALAASGLLFNPGFEAVASPTAEVADGWAKAFVTGTVAYSLSTTIKKLGSRSQVIHPADGSSGGSIQSLPFLVTATEHYLLGAFVYVPAGSPTTGCYVRAEWFDANDVLLSFTDVWVGTDVMALAAWQFLDGTVVAPAGAVRARVRIIAWTQRNGYPLYIDSVRFVSDSFRRAEAILDANDGVIQEGVGQREGSSARVLARGHVAGQSFHTGAITFPESFQGVPRVLIRGGIATQPNSALWSVPATFSATKPQYDDVQALDLSASGFTVRARLKQKSGGVVSIGDQFPVDNDLYPISGEVTAVCVLSIGAASGDAYTVHYHVDVGSPDGSAYVYIDSGEDLGGGAYAWTQRAATAYNQITVDRPHEQVTIVVSGLAAGDAIRLRAVQYGGNPRIARVHGFCASTGHTDPAAGVTYSTASGEIFASKTPEAEDRVDWEALAVNS